LTELVELALRAMLAMQRRSWEQGLAGHALLALGRFDLATVLAVDAVANQTPDGRLADIGDRNVVNGAAALEAVLAMATRNSDSDLAAAARRQVEWLVSIAPRADDGILQHVLGRREVWSDTVYMVVPALVAADRVDVALQQLRGHRRRLQDPQTHLIGHMWDEGDQRLTRADAWGGGNGWVVAGCARALHLLRPAGVWALSRPANAVDEEFVAEAADCAREVLDACLPHRADSGLFHDIVDEPGTFEEVTLAAMLAYSVSTGVADGWLPAEYDDIGRSLFETAAEHVGSDGLLRPACGSPGFDRPGISAEAQAWFLLAAVAAGVGNRRPGGLLPVGQVKLQSARRSG
jgi:unsaturated rhamnogalacturonyl hydrolase